VDLLHAVPAKDDVPLQHHCGQTAGSGRIIALVGCFECKPVDLSSSERYVLSIVKRQINTILHRKYLIKTNTKIYQQFLTQKLKMSGLKVGDSFPGDVVFS